MILTRRRQHDFTAARFLDVEATVDDSEEDISESEAEAERGMTAFLLVSIVLIVYSQPSLWTTARTWTISVRYGPAFGPCFDTAAST